MYISDEIPQNYKYIAEYSDNYIILVKETKLNSGVDYDAYMQFFSPSTEVIHITKYRIKNGDSYTYNYHYINNTYYNYIDYVSSDYSYNTIELTNRSSDLFDRHDYWSIGLMVALLLGLTILIVNLATSLIHKGGIFHA